MTLVGVIQTATELRFRLVPLVGVVHVRLVRLVDALYFRPVTLVGIMYRQLVRLMGVFIQRVSDEYLTRRKRLPAFF